MRTYNNKTVRTVQALRKANVPYSKIAKKLNIPVGTVAYLNKKSLKSTVAKAAKKSTVANNNVWALIADFLRPHLN